MRQKRALGKQRGFWRMRGHAVRAPAGTGKVIIQGITQTFRAQTEWWQPKFWN